MGWMAWTFPTAMFFASIAMLIAAMALWEWRAPSVERGGFLPMPTTRGDRLFIGLLTLAFVNMAWLGMTDLSQWIGLGIGAVAMLVIGRWG